MNDTNNLIATCVIGVGLAVLLSQLNSHTKDVAPVIQKPEPPIIVEHNQVVEEKKVIVKRKHKKPNKTTKTEIWDPWYFGFRRRKNENMG